VATARNAERLGYSTFAFGDHFMLSLAPLIALQAVADATTTLRLTQTVLNHDLRHPAVLAKELATLDLLSGGRVEVGIGAGWMREEYEQAGIPFDNASIRIERLEEVVVILKGLFADAPFSFSGKHFTITSLDGTPKPAQQPGPPIMIGGGGRKLLSVAGRRADIVQIMPTLSGGTLSVDTRHFTADAYEDKLGWVRDAARERFGDIELGVQLLNVTITNRPHDALDSFVREYTAMIERLGGQLDTARVSADELITAPVVAIGTLDQVCEKLVQTREKFGFSYFAAPVGSAPELMRPVIERLGGN